MTTTENYVPALKEVVKDRITQRLGEVMGRTGGYYQLRPLGGGREWDVRPGNVLKADPQEVLREKTAAANRRSRGELA